MTPEQIAHLAEAAVIFVFGAFALLLGYGKLLNTNTPTFNASEWHRKNDKKFRVIGWVVVICATMMAVFGAT